MGFPEGFMGHGNYFSRSRAVCKRRRGEGKRRRVGTFVRMVCIGGEGKVGGKDENKKKNKKGKRKSKKRGYGSRREGSFLSLSLSRVTGGVTAYTTERVGI